MRRALLALAIIAISRAPLGAQISIPNIRKPIDAATKAAGKTNAQIDAANKVGAEKTPTDGPLPAAAARAADQQKKAPPAPAGKAAPAPGKAGAATQAKGAAGKGDSAVQVSRRGTVAVMREAFAYDAGGRRDPFVSLMASGELRPILTDLVLTGVIYDTDGRRSIAMLVDVSTGENYQVRIGQTLGRMKVARIGEQSVTLNIDEFGFSRSETIEIDKTRKGPAGPRRP